MQVCTNSILYRIFCKMSIGYHPSFMIFPIIFRLLAKLIFYIFKTGMYIKRNFYIAFYTRLVMKFTFCKCQCIPHFSHYIYFMQHAFPLNKLSGFYFEIELFKYMPDKYFKGIAGGPQFHNGLF